ncbi:MAG: hypothetical protein EOM30_04155 [Clostridia bacterium]|nr:hypothetical protein [Clostridia bacterium]NLS84567.1 hypothetical protein [Oscillospiraceae bacterium]
MKKSKKLIPALIAVCFAIIMIMGYLFIFFFPNNTATTLNDINGTATQDLQGFTLKGSVYDSSWHRDFTLENGFVTNEAFKPYGIKPEYGDVYGTAQWYVAPSARNEVDANAKFILHSNGNSISAEEAKALSQGDGYYQSQCSDFVLMLTVNAGNGKIATFQASEVVHTKEPVPVQTYTIYNANGKQYVIGDYQISSYPESASELQRSILYNAFALNDGYYAAVNAGGSGAALYKITQLENVTQDINGEICKQPANLKTVEVGKAEKLCTFSGEKLLKAGAVDGSIYMQSYKDGKVLTRLMDANGASQSSKSVDVSKYDIGNVSLEVSTSDAQSFSTVISLNNDTYGTYLMTGFSVKDSKLANGSTAMYLPESFAFPPNYITLSEDGRRLLLTLLNYNATELIGTDMFDNSGKQNGVILMAFENESTTPYYEGWLNFNQIDDLQPADLGYVGNSLLESRAYYLGDTNESSYIYYQF